MSPLTSSSCNVPHAGLGAVLIKARGWTAISTESSFRRRPCQHLNKRREDLKVGEVFRSREGSEKEGIRDLYRGHRQRRLTAADLGAATKKRNTPIRDE